jgi:hypothetical protein
MPYSRDVDVPPGVHVVHVRSTSPNIAPPADRRDLRFFLEGYGVESLP